MVAAHMHDLQAAKKCGLHTTYVARHGEDTGRKATPDEVDYFVSDEVDLYNQLAK
ncbi:hypothetical protein LIPSTDRAFT_70383 [Lipomyces starkeyi NRRL Y-11557]|uniref:Haloacid dehalogenase, type II n=1 Tax=Lipomyces starkeyi NRRL Y-11557 TaxID=675824 RepID=A0A1E3Q6U1_LIPST|nr:hypothetical protein LIPSTDRAFT_70383 [Lipomyces starkeyi NRRL Y-11557]